VLTVVVVFLQWIPMLCFLGRMLFQEGFRFVYLWGEMDPNQQEMSIRAFQEVPEIKVMVSPPPTGQTTYLPRGHSPPKPAFANNEPS
jgi:SNF2 family DNA or RNA helicase